MPFDQDEADLLSYTQSLCRFIPPSASCPGGHYRATARTLDSLRAIELFLRRDHPTLQPMHLRLGRWQTLQSSLVPLLLQYRDSRELCYPLLKLIVRLTMALAADVDSRADREQQQAEMVEAMTQDSAVLLVLMSWLAPLLARSPLSRSEDETNVIELALTLVRNILSIAGRRRGAAGPGGGDAADDDSGWSRSGLDSRVVNECEDSGLLELLCELCFTTADVDKFGLLVLECIACLLAAVTPAQLMAAKQRQLQQSASSSPASRAAARWPALISPSSSLSAPRPAVPLPRHSRFGTLLSVQSPLLSSSLHISRNLADMTRLSSDDLPVYRGRIPAVKGAAAGGGGVGGGGGGAGDVHRGGEAALLSFSLSFVRGGGFGRLMEAVQRELRENVRVVREDERNWMTVAACMLGVWREELLQAVSSSRQRDPLLPPAFDPTPVESVLSLPAFALLQSKLSGYAAAKPCPVAYMQSALTLYREVVHTLQATLSPASCCSSFHRSWADSLRRSFFYHKEQVDLISSLMRSWRLHRERQPVMVLLAECAHWSMELLDAEGEAAAAAGGQAMVVVQRRKRVVRKTRRVRVNGVVATMQKTELAEALPARVITAKGKRIRGKGKGKKKKQEEEEQSQQAATEASAAAAAAAQPEPQQEDPAAAGSESSGAADRDPLVDEEMQERPTIATEQRGVADIETAAATSDSAAATLDSLESSAATLLLPQSPPPSSPAMSTEAPHMTDETLEPASQQSPVLAAQVERQDCAAAVVAASEAETQLEAMIGTQPAQDELATQLLAMDDDDVDMERELAEDHVASATVLSEAATQLVVQDSSETAEDVATLVVAETQQQQQQLVPSSVDASIVSSSPSSLSTLVSAMGVQATQVVPDSLTLTEAAQSSVELQLGQRLEAAGTGSMESVVPASIEDQLELQPDGPEEQEEQAAAAQQPTAQAASPFLPTGAAPVLATVITSSTASLSSDPRVSLERSGAVSTGGGEDEEEQDEGEDEEEEEEEEAEKEKEPTAQAVAAESGDAVAAAAAGGDGEAGVEYEEVEEEEEVEDPEVSEDGYVRRESAFNFSSYLLSYAQPVIVSHYLQLLSSYFTNSPQLNALIVSFLSRLAFDRELLPMLYQLSFFQLADTVLQDGRIRDRPHYRPVRAFCKKIVRAFFDAAQGAAEAAAAGAAAGGLLFAECLCWKSVKDVELIKSGYRGREKEEFNDRLQEEAAEVEDKKDREQEWKAEGQQDEDGDWKPEAQQSNTAQQVQRRAAPAAASAQAGNSGKQGKVKEKKPRKRKAKAAGSEQQQAGSEQRRDAAVSAAEDEDGDGEEIDIDVLMNEQVRKDKQREKREKAEQKRKAAEAKERDRERLRRALLDHSDDDEEELQLGQYTDQRDGGQQPLSPQNDDRRWTAQDEELLRLEIPIFAALRTKYLLVIPKLSSVWSEDEVRRKVEAMGILTAATGTQQQHEQRMSVPEPHAALHVQTTDDDSSSERDSSSGALDSSLSPAHAPFAALSASSSSAPPPPPPLQTAPASVSRGRAPSGQSIDTKRISARLYDIIASLTRRPAYHPLISALLSSLAACAEERAAETGDSRAYLLTPAEWAGVEAGGEELWRRGVLRLMAALQVNALGSRRWSLQRQYTAEKLQAVAAVVERAFENTKEDIAAGLLPDTAEDDDDDAEEQPDPPAQDDSETAAAEQGMDDAEDAAEAEERRAAREEREAIASALPRRETRKRKEAASASSQPPPQFVRAEDELDNAELAQFLRERRNRLQLMQQQQQLSSAAAASVAAADDDASSHRRLRKIAEADGGQRAEQEEDQRPELQLDPQHRAEDSAAGGNAAAAVAVSIKRRKVLLEDDEDDDDAAMQ